MANVLPRATQAMILRALGMGTPIRHIEHTVGVAQDTVRRYAYLAGEMAIDFLDQTQRDLAIEKVEVDELYSFVAARKRNVDKMKKKIKGAGEHLHFIGVEPKSGFIVNYHIARSNNAKHCKEYLEDLSFRLKRDGHGHFAVKPTIFTDGHGAYEKPMQEVFGTKVNYGRLTKQQTDKTPEGKKTRRHFTGVVRDVPIGSVPEEEFWTNNVESANRTARCRNRRLGRKTNAFSKRYRQHVGHFAFWMLYHNYCVIPDRRFYTRAKCAGVTDKIFAADDLVDLIELYQAKAKAAGLLAKEEEVPEVQAPVGEIATFPVTAPFWLYQNTNQHTVRIHRTDCNNCRNGTGRGGHTGRSGFWYPAQSLEAALERAEELEDERHSTCNMCIGTPRWMGRRL